MVPCSVYLMALSTILASASAVHLKSNTAEASSQNIAQEKDKIKTLIADISHQTKTPIANLLLYSELLMEETMPASAKANVEALYKQSEKLRFLIDSLVKLSRLENGSISLSPQQASLQPLLESVVEQYAAKASGKVRNKKKY